MNGVDLPHRGSITVVNVSIRRLSGAEFALLAPRFVDLYIEAMDYHPSIRETRIQSWKRDLLKPGFTSVIAASADDIIGVAYGFLGAPDHWWDRQLRRGMREQHLPEPAQNAIRSGYFEVAEIHVRPGQQGHGIGRRLITELLWNAPADRTLLSTPEIENEANGAFGLYRSLGFVDVLRHFRYPGDDRPFAVLGRELPLR